jgi:hypothetical protein
MIINRLWDIFTGITATLLVVAAAYGIGFSLTPTRFSNARSINPTTQIGAIGGVIAVLWGWYGLKLHIPFLASSTILTLITLTLAVIRRKTIVTAPSFEAVLQNIPQFLAMYSIFYIALYIFLLPPVDNHHLPITRIFNNDIFNYFILASYAQHPGTPTIANFSFLDTPSMMLQFTPAILTLFAAVATIFRGDAMAATMPIIFGAGALLGCCIAHLAQRAFNLSRCFAICVSLAAISTPFFRYIVGNYFLSSLFSTFFLLLLLKDSVRFIQIGADLRWPKFLVNFSPLYILIFYCYPPLCVIAIGLQAGLIFIYFTISHYFFRRESGAKAIHPLMAAVRLGQGLILSIALVAIVDPQHISQMVTFLRFISSRGGIGWPMDLISPLAIYASTPFMDLKVLQSQIIAIAVSALAILVVLLVYVRRISSLTSPAGLSVFLLSSFSLLTYFAFFFHSGATYQQWKIASYLPLPLSFALLGAIGELVHEKNSKILIPPQKLLLGICAGIVLSNAALHFRVEPKYEGFDADYTNLTALGMINGPADIYIKMASFSSTFFAVYFVHSKILHLLSPSYYSQETMDMRTVSPSRPLFLEGTDCVEDEGNIPIKGVGCLYHQPPHLEIGRQYDFSKLIPGLLEVTGLSDTETWGIWSDAKKVKLNLLIGSMHDDLSNKNYINLLLRPFTAGPIKSQRVQVALGDHVIQTYSLNHQQWISVPFSATDLRNKESRELSIELTLPDALAPNSVDPRSSERRLLGVGFVSLSVSQAPVGAVASQ